MHNFTFPVTIDIYKFLLYIEPSFFLFLGKSGALKTMLFYPVLLSCINNIFIVSISLVAFLNRFSKYSVVSMLLKKNLFFIGNDFIYSIYLYYKHMYKYFYNIRRLMVQIIFSIHRGWVRRLRLVGIGYKLYCFANLLVLKLGYSKCIFFLLPFDLHLGITGRKKRGFSLYSIRKLGLSLISRFLLQLRVPNIYTGKGIRMRSILFLRKLGKKSLF